MVFAPHELEMQALGLRRSPRRTLSINGRQYCFPTKPLVVVCLDGSSAEYIRESIKHGCAPFLATLVAKRQFLIVSAAMPTFTNPNNISIVTGVPPSQHGICGNYFLDRLSGKAVMMNDAGLLRARTIPSAFTHAGANVAVITAKNKLRTLLSSDLHGPCISTEEKGHPVYSAELSIAVLKLGVEWMHAHDPDILYMSTSDYMQHTYPPGAPETNEFYSAIDHELSELDRAGATLVITADHGMHAKSDDHGRPKVVFLQEQLDEWFRAGETSVILPITDPYTRHHGSLGSFAAVYLTASIDAAEVIERLKSAPGIHVVLDREAACAEFELPYDRTADVVVCADARTVIGTRRDEHDLSVLGAPLRSHGGLAERAVPMLFNRPLSLIGGNARLKNYDAFWVGMNALR